MSEVEVISTEKNDDVKMLEEEIKVFKEKEQNQLKIYALATYLEYEGSILTPMGKGIYENALKALEGGASFCGSIKEDKEKLLEEFDRIQTKYWELDKEELDEILDGFYMDNCWAHMDEDYFYDITKADNLNQEFMKQVFVSEKIDIEVKMEMLDHYLFTDFTIDTLAEKTNFIQLIDVNGLKPFLEEYKKTYEYHHDDIVYNVIADIDKIVPNLRYYKQLKELDNVYAIQDLFFKDGEDKISFLGHIVKETGAFTPFSDLYLKDSYDALDEEAKIDNDAIILNVISPLHMKAFVSNKKFHITDKTIDVLVDRTRKAEYKDEMYEDMIDAIFSHATCKEEYKDLLKSIKRYTELLGADKTIQEARSDLVNVLANTLKESEEALASSTIKQAQKIKKENE